MDTSLPDRPGFVGIKTRCEKVARPNVPAPGVRDPSDLAGRQSSKAPPASLPHAEVYTKDTSLRTPPHAASKSLCALLGPLTSGDAGSGDQVLALLIAYIARTSGEPTVAIGYVPGTVGTVVPFIVAVDGAAPFASLVERVAAERCDVEARRPPVPAATPAAAGMDDDDATEREGGMHPPSSPRGTPNTPKRLRRRPSWGSSLTNTAT